MDKPLVSIGIPAYNRPDRLRMTLQYIRDQTYPSLEVIVSDDCSPNDGVAQVVKDAILSGQQIQFYRQPENIGATRNFEFVLMKATGKYFLWAEDEDSFEPAFVEKLAGCMESQPDLVACTCDVNAVDMYDHLIWTTQLDTVRPTANWNEARKLFFRYPTSNIYFFILGMFRTDILKKSNIHYLSGWKGYGTYSEVPFLAQIAVLGRMAAIPETLKSYRHNPDSIYHAEIRSISWFDMFMLRLVIRFRLCKIAVMSDFPVLVRVSLLNCIFESLMKETVFNSMFVSFMGAVKKVDVIGNLRNLLGRAKRKGFIKNIIKSILRRIFGLEVHWIKHMPPGGIVKLIADNANLIADNARLEAEHVDLKQQKAELISALDDLQSIFTKFRKMAELQLVTSLQKFEIDLILDVGANIGQFGKEMRQCGYVGRIVSFEPLSQAHDVLLQSSEGDPMWDVCSRCALGDHNGDVEINIAGNSQSSSILPMLEAHRSAAPESKYQGKEITPVKMLDSLAGQYLKDARAPFLKIDTQGFEWQVLNGARETLPHIKGVLVELSLVPLYGGQHLWHEVIDRLEAEGFILWAFNPVFSDQAMGRTLQVDGVFFRKT